MDRVCQRHAKNVQISVNRSLKYSFLFQKGIKWRCMQALIDLRPLLSQIYTRIEALAELARSQTITHMALKTLQLALTGLREAKAVSKAVLLYSCGKLERFNFYGLNPQRILQQDKPAILFLHGDHHNQSAALPLASYLKETGVGAMFTVNLTYNDENSTPHRKQIFNRISEIKKLYEQEELKIIIVGHSKGAIEGAHLAFCGQKIQGVHIEKVISIAGRLKVVPTRWRNCHPTLQPLVNKVHQAIISSPTTPILYNIAGDSDWNAPIEAMVINDSSKHSHILRNHSHLSILFAKEAHEKVLAFIQE